MIVGEGGGKREEEDEGGGLFRFKWWVGVGYPGIPYLRGLVHCAPPKLNVRHSTSGPPRQHHPLRCRGVGITPNGSCTGGMKCHHHI